MNRTEFDQGIQDIKKIMLTNLEALEREFLDSNLKVNIGYITSAKDQFGNGVLIEVKHIEYSRILGEPTLIASGPEVGSDSPTYFRTIMTVPRNND